jgi:hypothetical protein
MGSGISKNILPGKEAPRLPLRNSAPKAHLNKAQIPLCQEFPTEGYVELLSETPPQTYEGLFSFTIYFRGGLEDFYESHYYCGLVLYAEMIHSHPRFKNVAMILYTDSKTLPILTEVFANYPKLLFAVTFWPKFQLEETVDGTVMRCMRFHATEAFPESWVCTRDADTIFTSEIMNAEQAYRKGYKGKTASGIVVEDYRPFYANLIGDWEQEFLSYWFKEGAPINLGVNLDYNKRWHKEFPLFYPIKDLSKKYSNKGYNGARVSLRSELGGRFKNYYKAKKLLLFMKAPAGIFAGFTNFSNRRPKDIWSLCYDYITSHYDLIEINSSTHKKMVSDEHVEFVDKIGKDERIIIFAVIPRYLDLCYFFSIEYYGSSWIYNTLPKEYSITTDLPKFSVLLDLGKIPSFKNNSGSGVKIHTVLFTPDYIKNVYEGVYDPNEASKEGHNGDVTSFNRKQRLSDELETYTFKAEPLNSYFKTKFSKFAAEYLGWIDSILKMNLNSVIKEIQHMKRITGRTDDYVEINNSDFYSPVHIIHPRKGGSRKKNNNNKSRKRRN